MSKRLSAAIKTIIMLIALSLLVLPDILVSKNYIKLYNFPPNKNACLDFEGRPMEEFDFNVITAGEWEFFYNKWIVTDNIEDKPDFLINVPGRWTGKTVNGEKLTNTGYASYRFTILNIQIGTEVLIELYNFPIAFRMFVNNELNCQSGILSKNVREGFASGLFNDIIPYTVTDTAPLEIVLELSYNNYGGLFIAPWINDYGRPDNNSMNLISITTYLVTGMMAAFVIFSIILNFGLKKERQLTFILLIFSIFCHLLTTRDVYWQFGAFLNGLNFAVIFELCFVTGALSMLCFLIYAIKQKLIVIKKPQLFIFCALTTVCTALYYILFGTAYQIIPICAGAVCFFYIIYLMLLSYRRKYSLFPLIILFILMIVYVLEALENLGVVVYTLAPGISFMLMIIMIIVGISSYLRIRDNANTALKALVLEKETVTLENEVGRIKHQALKSQVKPHFIFNVLSSIQKLYRKDTGTGEEALVKFATHLRQNIDADNNDTIPFNQEIRNIINYVELENLRLDKNLTLLLDIDYSDFEIPILSLQPLIENAIKYAGTENKTDGYIRIRAVREGNEIILQVVDNGTGFDIDKIRKQGVGLKNSKERFKYLLNAEMTVESSLDEGTAITVRIPYGNNEQDTKEQDTEDIEIENNSH